jgi:hypothetical protein
MTKISVVIPTIKGREHHLERCLAAYRDRSELALEVLIMRDLETCGRAWNLGAMVAEGEYLHLTADDLEPHIGWDHAAVEACERGQIPAPEIHSERGALAPDDPGLPIESSGGYWDRRLADWEITMNTCVVPFCRTRDWEGNIGPVLEAHYYTDNYFTDQCRRSGLEVVVRRAYAFTHHWAKEGRGAGMTEAQRMEVDRAIYEATRAVGQ